MNPSAKVAHLTSVHSRDDIRIFQKQCRSLQTAGFEVLLIVADGLGDDVVDGVSIIDAGKQGSGRIARMVKAARRICEIALKENVEICHIHDPELLPLTGKLRRGGCKVIFDSHEDYPAELSTKHYIPSAFRPIVARLYAKYERNICKKLDAVISATPAIGQHFMSFGCSSTEIYNYPLKSELVAAAEWKSDRNNVCYVGSITHIRGVSIAVDAMYYTESGTTLSLVGPVGEASALTACENSSGFDKCTMHGLLSRSDSNAIMQSSLVGLVPFLDAPNHREAMPNKLFEYMAAGIPIICSNFPLWKEIIGNVGCGICVEPGNARQIAAAIDTIYNDQDAAMKMGRRGRDAVSSKYNWTAEAEKLLHLYRILLLRSRGA